MKIQVVLWALIAGVALHADTIVVRQPGLLESLGRAAVGTVACTAEMCKGLVCGSTTVVQTPAYAAPTVIASPAVVAPVVATPVVIAPAVPLAPYGAYYRGVYGYRHWYGPCYGRGYYGRGCRRPCCR